jgi:salicylate hydroxylase
MRIAIAGGGIAGLTSAIALGAHGFEVDLYERAPVLEEIGAGIQLSPNAMAVLEWLGVTGELAGRLSEPEALVIRDAKSGAVLSRMPLGKTARERFGAPYCTLHRADLQSALLATARRDAKIALKLGAEVGGVRATESEVGLTIGGENQSADVLIAADGVRSAIRTEYFRHSGPMSLGRRAWRATLRAADVRSHFSSNEVGLWLGARAHLVHYQIAGGAILNVVVIAADETPSPPLAAFGAAARELINAISAWHMSPLVTVDASRAWTNGRVALIGDAAHAMAPSAAQGGAQAIEDAWMLAATLASMKGDPASALSVYARLRQPRVKRVAQLASRSLDIYEAKGVPALARNSVLRVLPARFILSRFDWLFGWKPKQN